MTIAMKGGIVDGSLTVTTTAQTLVQLGVDVDNINISDVIHISNNGAETIYYFYAGGTPTTASGHTIPSGGERTIPGRINILNLRLIAATGTIAAVYTLTAI